ncbi:hypothetical protein TIFTF001_007053 [Ficus carica]|uniref:Uncharacterized protein n=1 Tax=Ficus carica TaxID=3494 RepID=A0AA88CZA6_FICCA|nr:hypothetical protein TIFTF001_007053 [Ficus carica]
MHSGSREGVAEELMPHTSAFSISIWQRRRWARREEIFRQQRWRRGGRGALPHGRPICPRSGVLPPSQQRRRWARREEIFQWQRRLRGGRGALPHGRPICARSGNHPLRRQIHDGGGERIATEPGVETVPCGRRILAGSGQSATPPRPICAAHDGRLSLLRAAEGAGVVGDGRGGCDSGSGRSHSCWVAAAMLVDGR